MQPKSARQAVKRDLARRRRKSRQPAHSLRSPTMPDMPRIEPNPMVTISCTYEDPNVLVVQFVDPHNTTIAFEVVDVNPMPTWPTPAETADLIAAAVRKVWDASTEYYTGEPVERDQ